MAENASRQVQFEQETSADVHPKQEIHSEKVQLKQEIVESNFKVRWRERNCCRNLGLHLKACLVALLLFFQLLAGHHYKLFVYQSDRQLSSCGIICESMVLVGAAFANLISGVLYQHVPVTALTTLCSFVYAGGIVVSYVLSAYWTSIVLSLLNTVSINILLSVLSYAVADVCKQQSQKTTTPTHKQLLQTSFAIFHGLPHFSYVIASVFNIYFVKKETQSSFLTYNLINISIVTRCSGDNSDDCLILTNNRVTTHVESSQSEVMPAYVVCGLMAVILCIAVSYWMMKCATLKVRQPLLVQVKLVALWKCGLLVPCMTYNGLIEGYIFSDFILVNIHCFGFAAHTESALICYGAFGSFVCLLLSAVANSVNRVYRMTIISLFQISVIITLIVLPVHVQNAAIFYVCMALLGACSMLWRTQLSVLIALVLPENKLEGFTNYFLFHTVGYFLAASTKNYLCMNTKLYFLLAAAILAQFFYLVNELKLRILQISMQRGRSNKPSNFNKRPPLIPKKQAV